MEGEGTLATLICFFNKFQVVFWHCEDGLYPTVYDNVQILPGGTIRLVCEPVSSDKSLKEVRSCGFHSLTAVEVSTLANSWF